MPEPGLPTGRNVRATGIELSSPMPKALRVPASGFDPACSVSRAISGGDPCDSEMYALIRAEHRI